MMAILMRYILPQSYSQVAFYIKLQQFLFRPAGAFKNVALMMMTILHHETMSFR